MKSEWPSLKSLQITGETKWQRSRWHGEHLSTDGSGIHLQTQKLLQDTSWEQTGNLDHCKGIYRSMQNLARQMKEEKNQRVSRTGSIPGGWGYWNCNCLGQRRRIWDCWRVQQWSATGWRECKPYRQSLPQLYIHWAGMQVPWNAHQLRA